MAPAPTRIWAVGLLTGLLLNITGWLGNNLVLNAWWRDVGSGVAPMHWSRSMWSDVFSFAPDFVYGIAIAWLVVTIRPRFRGHVPASLSAGAFVAAVGGITTYFAIANSGFIGWPLAIASFVLVLGTKLPLAVLAGWALEPRKQHSPRGADREGRE